MFYEIPLQPLYSNNIKLSYKNIIGNNSSEETTIDASDADIIRYLRQAHNLRYNIFVKKLKWSYGFETINQMEFDNFDNKNATFLIHTNPDNQVDACVRFISTDKPYLLGDSYPIFVENQPIPRKPEISELTRFAVNTFDTCDKKLFARSTAAIITWGLAHGVEKFVSLTRYGMYRAAQRIGWDPTPMGEEHQTPDDTSIALEYTVSKEMLLSVCNKNNITPPIIHKLKINQKELAL